MLSHLVVAEPGTRGEGEFYRERGRRHLESQRTREGRRVEVHERDLTIAVPG